MCPVNNLSRAKPENGRSAGPPAQTQVKRSQGEGGTALEFSGEWTISGLASTDKDLRRWGDEITSRKQLHQDVWPRRFGRQGLIPVLHSRKQSKMLLSRMGVFRFEPPVSEHLATIPG